MRFIYTRTFIIFFICLCALTGLLFLNSQGALDQVKRFFLRLPGPVVKVGSNLSQGTKSFITTLYGLRTVANENIEIKNRLAQLQAELADAQGDIRDNQILRTELGFVKNSKLDLQACEVLSGNVLNLTDTVVLDCGSDQGVAEGQAVMASEHVVGKIIYVSKTTSTLLLATSSKFLMDARVSKTGQSGVVEGSFNSGLSLSQIPQSASLEKTWLIVTAGINTSIPKDLLIGEVGEVVSSPNDLFKKASLITPVDFDDLHFVFVIK